MRLGGLGVLDVILDGQTVFSAKSAGRLPSPDEILSLVRSRRL